MKRNKVVARGEWAQVVALAKAMANNLDEPKDGLVYVATDSLGGRRWTATGAAVDAQPSHDGFYLGFSEAQLAEVEFTSASSGAVIRARKDNKDSSGQGSAKWVFRFLGADVPKNRSHESGYATIMENLGLEVLHKDLPYEEAWARSAHFKYTPAPVAQVGKYLPSGTEDIPASVES